MVHGGLSEDTDIYLLRSPVAGAPEMMNSRSLAPSSVCRQRPAGRTVFYGVVGKAEMSPLERRP